MNLLFTPISALLIIISLGDRLMLFILFAGPEDIEDLQLALDGLKGVIAKLRISLKDIVVIRVGNREIRLWFQVGMMGEQEGREPARRQRAHASVRYIGQHSHTMSFLRKVLAKH